jgi:small GTP-binding protein
MQETKVIKILVVGDSEVGKSSLITRYNSNFFDLNVNSTIGVDFTIKNIEKNNSKYRIQFWDVAGKEKTFEIYFIYFFLFS